MGGRVLRVWPDSGRVEAALIAQAAAEGWVDASCALTISQLLGQVADVEALGKRQIAPLAAELLVGAAMAGTRAWRELAGRPRAWRTCFQAITELKEGLVSASELGQVARRIAGRRGERIAALAELFARYESLLERLRLVDAAGLAQEALAALRRGVPERLRAFSRLELKAVHDFPPVLEKLVEVLLRRGEEGGFEVEIQVPSGLSPEADAAVDPLFASLERHEDLAGAQLVKEDLTARPFGQLGRTLFSVDELLPAQVDGLSIESHVSVAAELRAVARTVRGWLAEGTAPEQIAVASCEPGGKAVLVEELERRGIPVRRRSGGNLGASVVGNLAASLPLLVEERFPAGELARLVSSPFTRVRKKGCPPNVASYLARAGVRDDALGGVDGSGAYRLRLEALAARSREREAERVRAVAQSCQAAIVSASRIPERGEARRMVAAWWSAVEALGLVDEPSGAQGYADDGWEALRLAAEAREMAAREALKEVAEQLLEATGRAGVELDRRGLAELLEAALDSTRLAGGGRVTGVEVLEPRELVGRELECVALVGASESALPRRIGAPGVLSDEERIEVNRGLKRIALRVRVGDEEGRAGWTLAEDRLIFTQALAAATRRSSVSFAREGQDGREQLASPFVEALAKRTGQRIVERGSSPVPGISELEGEGELRMRAALEASAGARLGAPEPLGPELVEALAGEPWLSQAREVGEIERRRARFFADEQAPADVFSGNLSGESVRERCAEALRFGPDAPLTASALADFGNCAFQGFLKHVIGLASPEPADEEPDGRAVGTYWHGVLEELFPALAQRGLLGKPASEVPEALVDEAIALAREKSEARAHVGHPALWRITVEQARSMVRRLLDADHRGLPFGEGGELRPELRFGDDRAEGALRTVEIPALSGEAPIAVRGRIDRLDRLGKAAGVVDYKLKADASSLKKRLLVSEFQVPLYLHVVRAAGLAETARGAWVSLRTGEAIPLEKLLEGRDDVDPDELFSTDPQVRERARAEGRLNFANAVQSRVGRLREGDFAIRPQDCARCDLKAVCRVGSRAAEGE